MMGKFVDLTGQKFGRLTVIERAEDYISPKGQHKIRWLCECSCDSHNRIITEAQNLQKGLTQSCGCLFKEKQYESHKKYNRYEFINDNICIIYASNTNNPYYFDKEDYELVKDDCWTEDKDKYLFTLRNGERITFHRFINKTPNGLVTDHIDGNRYNNCKNNLRSCTNQQNIWNRKKAQGTSGVLGVSFIKNANKWKASIEYNTLKYNLGYYETKDEAIIARLKAEKELFGEFAGQNFLFEQYGI